MSADNNTPAKITVDPLAKGITEYGGFDIKAYVLDANGNKLPNKNLTLTGADDLTLSSTEAHYNAEGQFYSFHIKQAKATEYTNLKVKLASPQLTGNVEPFTVISDQPTKGTLSADPSSANTNAPINITLTGLQTKNGAIKDDLSSALHLKDKDDAAIDLSLTSTDKMTYKVTFISKHAGIHHLFVSYNPVNSKAVDIPAITTNVTLSADNNPPDPGYSTASVTPNKRFEYDNTSPVLSITLQDQYHNLLTKVKAEDIIPSCEGLMFEPKKNESDLNQGIYKYNIYSANDDTDLRYYYLIAGNYKIKVTAQGVDINTQPSFEVKSDAPDASTLKFDGGVDSNHLKAGKAYSVHVTLAWKDGLQGHKLAENAIALREDGREKTIPIYGSDVARLATFTPLKLGNHKLILLYAHPYGKFSPLNDSKIELGYTVIAGDVDPDISKIDKKSLNIDNVGTKNNDKFTIKLSDGAFKNDKNHQGDLGNPITDAKIDFGKEAENNFEFTSLDADHSNGEYKYKITAKDNLTPNTYTITVKANTVELKDNLAVTVKQAVPSADKSDWSPDPPADSLVAGKELDYYYYTKADNGNIISADLHNHLSLEVKDKDGSVVKAKDVSIVYAGPNGDQGGDEYAVKFTLTKAGKYTCHMLWDDKTQCSQPKDIEVKQQLDWNVEHLKLRPEGTIDTDSQFSGGFEAKDTKGNNYKLDPTKLKFSLQKSGNSTKIPLTIDEHNAPGKGNIYWTKAHPIKEAGEWTLIVSYPGYGDLTTNFTVKEKPKPQFSWGNSSIDLVFLNSTHKGKSPNKPAVGDRICLIFHARDTNGQPYTGKLPDDLGFWYTPDDSPWGTLNPLTYQPIKLEPGNYISDYYEINKSSGQGYLCVQWIEGGELKKLYFSPVD